MTWTYGGNPSASAKDEVRFLVGDTDTTRQLVQDEEIDYVLGVHADEAATIHNYQAAADIAEAIAAKYASKMDRSIGPLSAQASQQYDHYVDLAKRLRLLAVTGGTHTSAIPGIPVLLGGGDTYLMDDWT